MTNLALASRWALRELRSGFSGFRIFFACLVLGVAAIAGVGSLSDAFLTGLREQGRVLLSGDAEVRLVHREANPQESAFLESQGAISEAAFLRGMAYAIKNGAEEERQLIELKAVDNAYPLYGKLELTPAVDTASALSCSGSICGAVAEQTFLDRVNVPVGGTIRIGTQDFVVRAVVDKEPDRISGGFSLGPHVMVSQEGLKRTGLVTVGSLINYAYRIKSPSLDGDTFKTEANKRFPDGGWEIRDHTRAAPGIRRFVEQVTMFLTLVGLTALAVGGVGAGQAITAFLDRKRSEIAVLKSLGADGILVFLVFFLEVMAIAVVAVVVGLILGVMIPYAVGALYGTEIPAPAHYAVYVQPLVLAAVFGLLSAAAFSIPPLARAREIAPASLFRDLVVRARGQGRLPYLIAAALCGVVVIALTVAVSPSPDFAGYFLAGAVAILALLRGIAAGLRMLLKRLPRPHRPDVRMALANLTRPGSATGGVVTALGLGLTLLATVSLLDSTIGAQIKDRLPGSAPSFFFVDIQPDEVAAFDTAIKTAPSAADYKRTPMIRGRIVKLNGTPVREAKIAPDARWAVNGDRGITYASTPPEGTTIVEGQWWDKDYRDETLISFDKALAEGMGLKLGDTMTLNVLGREMTGRIASLRKVDFTTGGQNFLLVLSPGLIDKAPHSFLATVRVSSGDEPKLYRTITDKFPNISTIRVKDAISEVNGLLQQLGDGVRAASLVTILAGLLVLAGAIAAGQRARLYDSTILKVLGATRARIAGIYAMEYGFLGLITGLIALGAGTLAASLVAENVLNVAFVFDLKAALITVFAGAAATLGFGLMAAWSALSAKPTSQLRNP